VRVAIIGAGNIGGTLARRLAQAGHSVALGVRDPSAADVVELTKDGAIRAITPSDAVAGADAVVIAVPGHAVADVVRGLASAIDGKVVVDASNNIGGASANSRDVIAAAAPGARYVRAFNSLGFESLADPEYGGVTADGFYAAVDSADDVARDLITAVGLNPVHVGGAAEADVVDGVLRLWFALAFGQKRGRGLAFKVLTR
jgi:predicted dinucleotide-binding enzyme